MIGVVRLSFLRRLRTAQKASRHINVTMVCKAKGPLFFPRDTQKQSLLLRHQIPEQYREDFIQGHYRPPNSSLKYCLCSAFQWHNETMNFWTHFFPILVLEAYCWIVFPCNLWPPSTIPSKYYPLVCLSGALFCNLLLSSLAHLFMCMEPRTRHLCFFLDYTSICILGTGGACTVFWFERPVEGWLLFQYVSSQWVFLPLVSATSVFACFVTCNSRHYWHHKNLIRAGVFAFMFFIMNIPGIDRVVQCILIGRDCSGGVVYMCLTYISYTIGVLTYAFKVPERWFPGRYDLIGSGHQWMHFFTSLGPAFYITAIATDLKETQHLSLDQVTFLSSVAWVLITLVGCLSVVFWSWSRLSPSGELRR